MAKKHKHEGEEPVGWVTIKGVHFPKWADGTIGWQSGEEENAWNYNHNPEGLSYKYLSTSKSHSPKGQYAKGQYANTVKSAKEYKKEVQSRNARYDTSRASSKKIKPTNLQAFKENARQANEALAEGVRRNALEVHYKGITDEVYKYYWNGATFQRDKVKQDMAKKYGKKAGVYKVSFKKPKDWE